MATKGIEAVFVETHNWGKAAKFFQALGFELEFSTDRPQLGTAAQRRRPLRVHRRDPRGSEASHAGRLEDGRCIPT